MAETAPTARVAWDIRWDDGAPLAKIKGRDTVTQREYLLNLPLHMLPALGELIADAVATHPELFPDVITERRG